jgi:serine/threonine protein kinase
MIGQTISHYRILEKLGGGGMGVVYKAEDTKLKRTVALKFLPPVFSFDQEAKKRFINEAQAASSLQHHNICNIHDIDETKDGQIFICMDCYEGETLKKKIERGQIKADEAVDIIVQVATGLQKAHEKGIIHRDIKPANIFITNDGVVKILDFGLAKLSGQTMMTKMGETVGTIAYMSPEQTRGELVDQRTDIWSLGVVLYEMLTRDLPFKGDYDSAMIYSILNSNQEPITGLRDDIPVEIEQIVNKCLDKDKEYRYQRIDDLLIDLRRLKRETSGVSIASGDLKRTTTQLRLDKRKGKKNFVFWSAGILLVAAVCAIIFWPSGPEVQLNPKRIIRTLNLPYKQILYPSISADGNWIAFPAADVNGDWNIYLSHSTSGEAPIKLVSKEWSWSTEISPDGSHILYNNKIIPSSGGIPKILDSLNDFRNPQWSPDGLRLGFIKRIYESGVHDEFWTSSSAGTDLRKEFTDTIGGKLFRNFFFAWSPDGNAIAWIRDFEEGNGYQEIFTHNLETGAERQLTFAKSNIEAVCWSAHNAIIFSATISGPLNLWMVPAEGGELTQITFGDGPDGPPRISSDGRKLIFPKMKMVGQIMIIPVSGGEPKLVTAGEQTVWGLGPKLSPDGQQVVVAVGDLRFGWVGARGHLYIMNRDGSRSQNIKVGVWENLGEYSWSSDGKWLTFRSCRLFGNWENVDVYILNVAGNNQPKKISRFEKYEGRPIWIDSLNLSIKTKDKFYTYSINNEKMMEDTVLYYPIKAKSELLMQDLKGNWWILKNGTKNKLEPPDNAHLSIRNLCWTQWEEGKPFRTTSLISGKVKEYPNLIGPKLLGIHNLSDDGKEIIFSTREFNGQISIIENPFLK